MSLFDLFVDGEHLAVVEADLPQIEIEERLGPNCHVVEHGQEADFEVRVVRPEVYKVLALGAGCGYSRMLDMPVLITGAAYEPVKPWVRKKDWEQRAPRRRRRR